jgi:hypothetical protein
MLTYVSARLLGWRIGFTEFSLKCDPRCGGFRLEDGPADYVPFLVLYVLLGHAL